MKNKILSFSCLTLLGLTFFTVFAASTHAITDASKFDATLDYAKPFTYDTYKTSKCPTAIDEPIDGKLCYDDGKVIRETSDPAVAYCADPATITTTAADVAANNWWGFNCLRNTEDTKCRAGAYCKDESSVRGACIPSAGDPNSCVPTKKRNVRCNTTCGACLTNYVECPTGADICTLKYIGPSKLYGDTSPNTPTKYDCASRGAEANPCTGVCECPAGFTYSGRVKGQCISFLDRFKEIFEDGLTWLGGQTWLGIEHSYDYSVTGPPGLSEVFLKSDVAETINFDYACNKNEMINILNGDVRTCAIATDCNPGESCSSNGICYTPGATSSSCTDASDCELCYSCGADGECTDGVPPLSSIGGLFVGLTASYTGNLNNATQTGYAAAANQCDLAFTDSHICTSHEIMHSYSKNAMSSTTGMAWVNNGAPGYIKSLSNDCSGWTSNYTATYGSVINIDKSGLIANSFYSQPCVTAYSFACCK